jgi:hypothetical protein
VCFFVPSFLSFYLSFLSASYYSIIQYVFTVASASEGFGFSIFRRSGLSFSQVALAVRQNLKQTARTFPRQLQNGPSNKFYTSLIYAFAHVTTYDEKLSMSMSSRSTSFHSRDIERVAVPVPPNTASLSLSRRRPAPAIHTLSEEDHSPGWRSWLDRDNFAFFIFGLLVSTVFPRAKRDRDYG